MMINPTDLQVQQVRQEEMRQAAARHNLAKRFANVNNNTGHRFFNWFRSQTAVSAPVQATSLKGRTC